MDNSDLTKSIRNELHKRRVYLTMHVEGNDLVKADGENDSYNLKEVVAIVDKVYAEKMSKSKGAAKLAKLGVSSKDIAMKLDMHYSHVYSAINRHNSDRSDQHIY